MPTSIVPLPLLVGCSWDGAMNWNKVDMETNHSTTRIRTSL
jgi:hypothetical protein